MADEPAVASVEEVNAMIRQIHAKIAQSGLTAEEKKSGCVNQSSRFYQNGLVTKRVSLSWRQSLRQKESWMN